MNLTLKVWRQNGPNDNGRIETYPANNIPEEASFLEMIQMDLAIDSHQVRMEAKGHGSMSPADRRMALWLQRANVATLGFVAGKGDPDFSRSASTRKRICRSRRSSGIGRHYPPGQKTVQIGVIPDSE